MEKGKHVMVRNEKVHSSELGEGQKSDEYSEQVRLLETEASRTYSYTGVCCVREVVE